MRLSVSRVGFVILFMISMAGGAHTVQAAYLVKKSEAVVSRHPVRQYILHAMGLDRRADAFAAAPTDEYKGIVALVGGSMGMACIIVTIASAAFGFLFAGFALGIVGIIFGAMRKTTNKGIGLAGLILGVLDVTLILALLVALIVALASFT